MQRGQAICGAKTRKAGPCQDIAMPSGRCKKHGGKATGALEPLRGDASPVRRHGIYESYYTPEEVAFSRKMSIGSVEDELALCRIRLKRTLDARAKWEAEILAGKAERKDDGSILVLVEHVDDESVTKDGDVVPTERKTFRLPDFDKIEQSLLARIESLEKTQRELTKDGGPSDLEDPAGSRDRVRFTGGLGGTDGELDDPVK